MQNPAQDTTSVGAHGAISIATGLLLVGSIHHRSAGLLLNVQTDPCCTRSFYGVHEHSRNVIEKRRRPTADQGQVSHSCWKAFHVKVLEVQGPDGLPQLQTDAGCGRGTRSEEDTGNPAWTSLLVLQHTSVRKGLPSESLYLFRSCAVAFPEG